VRCLFMSLAERKAEIDPNTVVSKSFINACQALGLKFNESAKLLGINASTLTRSRVKGIDPKSKTGEIALQFIRAYRSLYAIAGGDKDFMLHWFNGENKALHDSPRNLVGSIMGLIMVNQYLDAMRGKV
jgi:hypothetical protein